jgi:hypothetical protein
VTEPTNGEKLFSWAKLWTTPMGVFVVVITFVVALGTYTYLNDRQETLERRRAFCESERDENIKQRQLWDFVIQLSMEDTDRPRQTLDNLERRKRFLQFIEETFPTGDCALDPTQVPKPIPEKKNG